MGKRAIATHSPRAAACGAAERRPPMRIAILSDIHANLEALRACLEAAAPLGVDRWVCLGDVVGYGADPEACVEAVARLAGDGAVVLKGNHDAAVEAGGGGMTDAAAAAIAWTAGVLSPAAREFLAGRPAAAREGEILYVHDSADHPGRWTYILGPDEAADCLAATDAFLTVAGHTHVPAHFSTVSGLAGTTGKVTSFRPLAGKPLPLARIRRHVAVMGSVGQPRDGDPRAAFGLLDLEAGEITWHRVPYDIDAAAEKIRRAGLPARLAARLHEGR